MIALGPSPRCPGPDDADWMFQLDEMDDEIRVLYLELIQQMFLYAVYMSDATQRVDPPPGDAISRCVEPWQPSQHLKINPVE